MRLTAADVNIGIIYLIAVGSLGVYGVVLGGWASNNKFSFLGSLRAAAQMVSYEIPLGLSLLCVILTAGTIRPDVLVPQQLEGQWYLVQQPLAALIFYVCMLAEANRAPFDLAEAEAELVGGWHTEYSSMKWALFFLGEYIHLVVGSAFFAVLFLGGWSLNPLTGWDLPVVGGLGMILLQVAIMFGKVFLLICLTMMVRWTLPRFRFDQLMRLAWEEHDPSDPGPAPRVTSFFVFFGWVRPDVDRLPDRVRDHLVPRSAPAPPGQPEPSDRADRQPLQPAPGAGPAAGAPRRQTFQAAAADRALNVR